MGKKGKNKNVVSESSSPKVETVVEVKPEKKDEVKVEPPKVEQKIEALKVEQKVEPPKVEPVVDKSSPPVEENSEKNDETENESGTLKSKKKRNKKKKNTNVDESIEETPAEKPAENVKNEPPKVETLPAKVETAHVESEGQGNTDTLKKKRKRNRNKNKNANAAENETKVDENVEEETEEVAENSTATSATSTLKKRKRNRNKNKNATNDAVNEALAAAQKVEPPIETPPADKQDNQSRKSKKQKRFDLTSKKTILDEIQEKQEKEQKEARDHIQKEIAKREKLLETIDMVLDCHKTEAELAKNQQESLKDLTKLAQAPKPNPKKSKQKQSNEEKITNKIEQVLGATKLEILNVQNQQAYVDRLETELAKVKQSKDILLGGESSSSSALPPQIKQMTSQICDLSKETPKSKEELIKEIQNRDKLMSEINRVLDTTKTEIEKVQKQQKVIANLEVELTKMKEQEVAEKLMALEEEAMEEEEIPPPPISAASASLLDALMANVGKLKEAQAQKEKQKTSDSSKKAKAQSPPKSTEKEVKKAEEPKQEEKKSQEKIESKAPSSPKDTKKSNKNEKPESPKVEKAPSPPKSSVPQEVKKVEKVKPQEVETKPVDEKPKTETKPSSPKDLKKNESKAKESPKVVEKAPESPKSSKPQEIKKVEELKQEEKKSQEKIEQKEPSSPKDSKKNESKAKESPKVIEKAPSPPKSSAPQEVKKVDEVKPQEVEKKPVEEKPKTETKPSSPKDSKKNSQKAPLKSPEIKKDDEIKLQEVEKKSDEKSQTETTPSSPKESKKSESKPKVDEPPKVVKAPVVEKKLPENLPKEIAAEKVPEPPKEIVQPKIETKPVEVQPITSTESPKAPEKNKQNDNKKNKKDSPKGNAKNKNKKDSPVPEKKSPEPIVEQVVQKPSMAEMLKNAPDPPPEELIKKEEIKKVEEIAADDKIEQAPLARPESAIIEVPIVAPQPEKVEVVEKPIEVVTEQPKVADDKKEASPIDENMVIVSQSEVEEMIKELEKNEPTDPKNDVAGGFASPANDLKESVKPPPSAPTKNDGKSSKTPAKSPSKPSGSKPAPKILNNAAKPKVDTNKPKPSVDSKKPQPAKPAPVKQQKPTESTPKASESPKPESSPPKVSAPKSENVPKPPNTKPDPSVSKTSASKPVSSTSPQSRAPPKAGNVTKTVSSASSSSSRPTKSNTPSPSKSPSSVLKSASNPQSVTSTASSKPKIAINTRPTSPKTPTTVTKTPQSQTKQQPAKTNASNKPSSSTASKQPPSTSDSVSRHRRPLNNFSNFSQPPAFSLRKMDEKSTTPLTPQTPNQMKAILTADGSIKISFLPPTSPSSTIVLSEKHRSKDVSRSFSKDLPVLKSCAVSSSVTNQKMPKPINLMKNLLDDDDDDDTFSQYKLTPKNIFMATICHVCKVKLSRYYSCRDCKMISYCKEEHMKIDYLNHKGFCLAVQLIAKRRGGHIYNMSKHLSSLEFRNLRIHSILLCEEFLNRPLCAYERELLLFPRICHEQKCREWKESSLSDCEKCGQVSFCTLHPLTEEHDLICNNFALLQRIVLHEKSYGRIHVELPQKVLKRVPILTENSLDTLRLLYRNIQAFQDDCVNASLMNVATTPLTAFYGYQKSGLEFNEQMVIHLVGAEMQFEGDTLDKWEAFFLHLAHGISDLLVIFIGPELNTENLPLEIISRTRMCKSCRLNCCGVRFDFQCKKFYHDYCSSLSYIKPDLVCFFNPALYRPGFRGFETWPKSIKSAIKTLAPIIVTSTTENENFLDLQKIQKVCDDEISVLMPPQKNPYASTRPERNFVSDDDVSIMFKNNYMFVVSDKNLIEL